MNAAEDRGVQVEGRTLKLVPVTLREANAFVEKLHRHHGPTRGHKFAVAVGSTDGLMRGVAIAGRPVARHLDDGVHLEVLRVCTDGTPNVCSMLYGAVRRAAVAMGYPARNVLTYTLTSEPGTSLRAAGWHLDGVVPGRSWDTPTRRRTDKAPTVDKNRWRAGAPTDLVTLTDGGAES